MMVLEQHIPVLQQDSIKHMIHDPHGIYIDATFGRGGHTREILKRLSSEGRLIVIDKDPQAIEYAKEIFGQDGRVLIHQGCFSDIADLCRRLGCYGSVDGILFDLGVSSPQLDSPERGFSFRFDGPLDMRMDTTQGESAQEWLSRAEQPEVAKILKCFGEEQYAKRIATNIVEGRKTQPITTTKQLVGIIERSVPKNPKVKKHPATKSFQAIRIHVNQEMSVLEKALEAGLAILAPKGRLCAISFHSLEDRIVKRFMRDRAHTQLPAQLPVMAQDDKRHLKIILNKVKATAEEVAQNPRARSAILRIAQKIG